MRPRAGRWIRCASAALLTLGAGCAHAYDEPTTETYIIGTLFVILGIALGVALILSLNEG